MSDGRSNEKWVVFDLGGVLLGWDVALLQEHLPELVGMRDPTAPLVARFFGTPGWKAFDRGEVDEVGLATALSQGEHGHTSVARMRELIEIIRQSLVPMPEKVAYLRRLADRRSAGERIRVGYLSNMPKPYARQLLAQHAWFSCFDAGLFSGDLGLMKPDSAIFRKFEALSGVSGAQHLFIDDYPHNLVPAQQLGWATSHAAFGRDYSVDVEDWLRG